MKHVQNPNNDTKITKRTTFYPSFSSSMPSSVSPVLRAEKTRSSILGATGEASASKSPNSEASPTMLEKDPRVVISMLARGVDAVSLITRLMGNI